MGKLWNVAVVGATGIGGRQIMEFLEEREFPSERSHFWGAAGAPVRPWSSRGHRL